MKGVKKELITNKFQSYLYATKQHIHSELSNLVSRISPLKLHSQIEYALLSKGKRLRPILVVLSAQSVGGSQDKVMPLALAFELIHTATLVHDDIIDRDELRRGIPALHEKWDINDAILAGDAMIALAVNLAADFGTKTMKIISQSALELCNGEHMDISISLNKATEEEYFSKIKGKAASLFRASAQCGAMAGGGSNLEVKSLTAFGENFGIAYQLKDDFIDLTFSGSSIPKDLKIGRIALPLIHLYKTSDYGEKAILENHLQTLMREDYKVNKAVVKRLLYSLETAGSLKYCERKIFEYVHRAVESVSLLKDTAFKTYLTQMAIHQLIPPMDTVLSRSNGRCDVAKIRG